VTYIEKPEVDINHIMMPSLVFEPELLSVNETKHNCHIRLTTR